MSKKSKAAEFIREGLNITITGRNLEVTEGMRAYAIEKIAKIEKLHPHRIVDVIVTMETQRWLQKVDMVVKVGRNVFKCHGETSDMYASIDEAVNKLETQLLKLKNKLQDHHGPDLTSIDMTVNVFKGGLAEINGEIEEESNQRLIDAYRSHEVVKTEKMPLKILTQREAIVKMDACQDAFMIFRNEEDMKVKVIFRRDDGDYGIIDPEL